MEDLKLATWSFTDTTKLTADKISAPRWCVNSFSMINGSCVTRDRDPLPIESHLIALVDMANSQGEASYALAMSKWNPDRGLMKALAGSRSVPSLLAITNRYLIRPLDEGTMMSTYLEDIFKPLPLQSRRPYKDHIRFSYPPVWIIPLYSIISIHLTSGYRCLDGLSTRY